MNEEFEQQAIALAIEVRLRAWAPYSRFMVGCCLVDSNGGFHVGCNVENASYGLTQCAERAAVTAATAAGCRDIVACVIVTDTEHPVMPCGACRQVLLECAPNIIVVSSTTSGTIARSSLSTLLPGAFGAEDLPQPLPTS